MDDDKRKHRRFPSTLETIYFTEFSSHQGDERLYFPGIITNKSVGGVGLRVSYRHEPNDRIWLEGIGIPNQPLPARVCWISSNDSIIEEYQMGVEFVIED